MSIPNRIYDSANTGIIVTNIEGASTSGVESFSGLPLGTVAGSTTGELALKVKIVEQTGTGGGSASTAAVFTTNKQYTTASTDALATTAGTVFTLAAGEKGYIQNANTASLAVKYGTGAASTSLNFLLKAAASASAGDGDKLVISDWAGIVSVAAGAGTTLNYLAFKLS